MTYSGNWDQNFLFDNLPNNTVFFFLKRLPNNTVEMVLALSAPSSGDGPDIIGCGGTSTRHFSVKSNYNMQDKNHANNGVD